MPRPAAPARRCRRTIIRPGRSSPASTAPKRNVVYERLDNGAQENVVQLREAPAKEKNAEARRRDRLPARRIPSHRDAGRLGQRAASPFLWPQPRASAQSPDRRHEDRRGQALHGKGEDPDAAAHGAAGEGNAEVRRGLRILRRARGRRVLDPGPSAVRDAPAPLAAGAAGPCPAARSEHPHRADGQRRGRPDGPRQPRRGGTQPPGLHQPRGHGRRPERLARRGL